jgi:uncharacterized protein YidB (DUF937 family)
MANSSRMIALLGLLAVAGYQHRDQLGGLLNRITGRDTQPGNAVGDPRPAGGWLDGPQSAFGGTASEAGSGILGGLKDIIDRFTGSGHQEVAKSWVQTGPNQQPTVPQLEQALGEDTIAALTQQTGLSKDELLARLQAVLPNAVDKLTPDGRLPTLDQAGQAA